MNRKILVLLSIPIMIAMILGCSFGGFFGSQPTSTPTATKTFVPTFTATGTIVPIPTETPAPPETPTPTVPPETPTPTATATATLGPPTNTPAPRPPTATPRPRPTNTPQPVYEFNYVSGPIKDPCHAIGCIPEISGRVVDAQGNPIQNYEAVWVKLDSQIHGTMWCRTGDQRWALQPGQFKFSSPDGQVFRDYTVRIFRDQNEATPLSAPLQEKMNAITRGQQSNIIFQRTHEAIRGTCLPSEKAKEALPGQTLSKGGRFSSSRFAL
jgi:hypothetical protein